MLVLRVIVGVVFILHGWMKVKMGIAGTTGFFSSVGIPFPMVVAWFSILAEVAGGAAQAAYAAGVMFRSATIRRQPVG